MVAKRRDDETPDDASSQSAPSPTQTTDRSSQGLSGAAAVAKAYLGWQHAVQAAWLDYRTKSAALHVEMINAQNNEQTSASKPLWDAHKELRHAMGTALLNAESQEKYHNAWQGFYDASVEFNSHTGPSLQDRLTQIRETFAKEHQALLNQWQQSSREAHEAYVNALKATWQDMPGTNVDPATLHSIAWAATQAAYWQPPKP